MIVYLLGALIVTFSVNFPMLLAGFIVTGIAVGAGVPASWTYISETSEDTDRARNIGISQFAWSMGPALIFTLGVIFAPLGLLGNRILFAILAVVAFIAWSYREIWTNPRIGKSKKLKRNLVEKNHILIKNYFQMQLILNRYYS
jgi:Arabinose efflux permease